MTAYELSVKIFILLLSCPIITLSDDGRTLVITSGGNIKLIVGLSMPVELPVSLSWVQNIQYQYMMVDNATQLSYMSLLRSNDRLVISRNQVYDVLINAWNSVGSNGTDCILQVICDIAKYPLSQDGILGEIIDTVFTPHKTSYNIYKKARKIGKLNGNCRTAYPYCDKNILEYFTKIC